MPTRSAEQNRPTDACCGSCKCFVTTYWRLSWTIEKYHETILSTLWSFLIFWAGEWYCRSLVTWILSWSRYSCPVVFGTGSNACYLERTDAIIKSQGLLTTSRSMVLKINSWSILRNKLSYFRSQNVKDLFIHSVSGSQYGVGKFFVLTPAKDFIWHWLGCRGSKSKWYGNLWLFA